MMYEWGADESHFAEGKRTYPDYERPRFIDVDACHGCGMDMKSETKHWDECDRREWNNPSTSQEVVMCGHCDKPYTPNHECAHDECESTCSHHGETE